MVFIEFLLRVRGGHAKQRNDAKRGGCNGTMGHGNKSFPHSDAKNQALSSSEMAFKLIINMKSISLDMNIGEFSKVKFNSQ